MANRVPSTASVLLLEFGWLNESGTYLTSSRARWWRRERRETWAWGAPPTCAPRRAWEWMWGRARGQLWAVRREEGWRL